MQKKGTDCNAIQRPTSSDMENTDRAKTVRLENKKKNPTRNLTILRGILVRSRELESLAL